MALTPEEIDALPVYTSSQQLKLWMRASIEVAQAGVSMAISGRSLTRNNAAEIRQMIDYWDARVQAEASGDNGGGIALVQFGDQR